MEELLKGVKFDELPEDHKQNLLELLKRVNVLREAYGKPMHVTSGYRSKADQLRIYKAKGITDIKKIPMKSKHLSGQSVDIFDPNKQLQTFINQNIPLVTQIGLWFEHFDYTVNWCHIQIVPVPSGARFFKP